MVGAATTSPPCRPRDRPPQQEGPERSRNARHLEKQARWLKSDFLTPLVGRAALSDVPSWLSPWPLHHDRGKALEEAWSYYSRTPPVPKGRGTRPRALDCTFADLRVGEKQGWRPSLVFAPMMVEDGRRLVISNIDFRYPISNDGTVLSHKIELLSADELVGTGENHSVEALELFRMFPDAISTFRVSTAARMSASFPYFGPAVSLPTIPRRRVVDAGYYDNYGVSLASSWLFSGSNQAWIRSHCDRILLIQIRDG
jgi:hypothetical protein